MTAEAPKKYGDILKAATDLFLEYGFQDISIGQIMDQAGCSRETVYRYFKNKEEIFQAVVDNQMSAYLDLMDSLDMESEDLRQGLLNWVEPLIKNVTSEPYIRLRRVVISEVPTRPEHGRMYYHHTYEAGTKKVASFFRIQQEKNKVVKNIDPWNLAAYLVGMLLYGIVHERLYGVRKPPTRRQIRKMSEQVVDDFLFAFGSDKSKISTKNKA